jgi:aspartate/methionine/tyrosine aminotransferase
MEFSKRTAWNTEESDLAAAHRRRLAAGLPIADLTASNPTRCGFQYAADLLAPLTGNGAFDYEPDPRGQFHARQAVSRYYLSHGARVSPREVLLTTSTSEAYGYLFKLLMNPGETVLAPQPSYPLFDFLAQAESVELASTPLVYDHGWQLDLEGLRRQITPKTRAVVLVHPNNPTGHFTGLEEAQGLAAICREHSLALIVDEVFLDYAIDMDGSDPNRSSFAARELDVLTFVVSGISKICALPQMKVAWLVAHGPGSNEALERLEVLADTWLSMNAPVQQALPIWLDHRDAIQDQIRQRVRANLAELDRALAGSSPDSGGSLVNRLTVEGGWYAILRIPALQRDEVTVRELLDLGVWVHPGYFFGMGQSGWLVLSLLTPFHEFSTGVAVLLAYLAGNHKSYQ